MGVAAAARYYHKDLPLGFKIELINKLINDRHRENRSEALQMINNNFDLLPYDLTIVLLIKV